MKWVAAVAVFACATLAVAGDNAWTPGGPEGGRVRHLAPDPFNANTLYAGGDGGVWKSVDAGATWSPARNGIDEHTITSVAVAPAQVAYAGSRDGGGVFKSSDGGANWARTNNGLAITQIASLAIDPVSPAIVYAGTACCGIYKSANAGASWTWLRNGGLPDQTISAIVIDPTNPAIVYAGTQSAGVFKSTNAGATWAAVNTGLGTPFLSTIAIDRAAPTTLYAATGNGVFKTVDGGATWAASNGALVNPSVQSLVVDPTNTSTLYIGLVSGIYKSVNGGASWTQQSAGTTSTVQTLAIDPRASERVYAGSELGVFATTNGGTSWARSVTGLYNTIVQAVALDKANPNVAYAGTGNLGIFKTVDAGATWTASNTGLSATGGGYDVRAIAIDPSAPSTIYLGNGSGMYKSVDSGASWTAINHGTLIRNITSIVLDPQLPNTVRVSTFFTGVFVSTNGGDTWATENAGLPASPSVRLMAGSGGTVMVGTTATETFAHDATSTAWRAVGPLPPGTQLGALAPVALRQTVPSARGEGVEILLPGWVVGSESALIAVPPFAVFALLLVLIIIFSAGVDTTVGNVWQPVPMPTGVDGTTCPPIRAIVAAPTPGSFYAGGACGVLAATNNGNALAAMNSGMPPNLQITSLAITPSGNDLYAGAQGGGVFRYTKSGAVTPVTVVEYYNQSLDHYFITWVPAEQANLDAGNTPTRWTRTGYSFKAYTTPTAGASPVCRYYIPPNLGDSHFFGRGTQECNATGQANPSFTLESPDFMQMFLPSAGTCPAGTINVYRVFSNRPDANHRYMTDPAVRAQMVARGWLVEGDGPDAVVMCAPQ